MSMALQQSKKNSIRNQKEFFKMLLYTNKENEKPCKC